MKSFLPLYLLYSMIMSKILKQNSLYFDGIISPEDSSKSEKPSGNLSLFVMKTLQ